MNDSNRYAGLSNEQLEEVHAACETFEQALQNERPMRIEDCLAAVSEQVRGPHFRELLAIELEGRMPFDTPGQITEYRARFPDRHDDIERVFQELSGSRLVEDLPKRIGRYRIEKVLGTGAFGRVYLAFDEELKRPVAVKVPHAALVTRPEDVERCLTEARTVANLDHPHIVPVHDVGSTDDFPCYIVSKCVEGTDLAVRIKRSRLSYLAMAELVAALAEALHYAHKQGLVHRDVKPRNILIDDHDRPYLVDFGLALRDQDLGSGPRFAGTPHYMSPEQARSEGHRVDGRSDIYSLGAVFYELLAGRRTFSAESQAELLEQITSQEARPPRQIDDRVPKELERICLKALAKRASDRYTTALDMAEDLRHFLETSRTSATAALDWPPRTAAEPSKPVRVEPSGSTTRKVDSDSRPIKIVPKGLRAFDEHDADFFLELLPGPRDRDGLPECIRFWKTKIEETDPDKTFSVGLIYGPSGCGKSSLVQAGLLPRLSANVIAVYVEATPEGTEARLLGGLRKHCPGVPGEVDLKQTLAALRRGQGIPAGKKVLIVLDQFEQWLHATKPDQSTELVQTLRQCDGARLQCVVMVRDDFWLAVSRFMLDLEVDLVPGRNVALVDLIDLDHARKLLAAFGRAFGRLSENQGPVPKAQRDFLKQVVNGLAEEGKVVCVRLALFAEMMKSKPWTPAALKFVGGTQGVGVTFLEETFSARGANPKHRRQEMAARAVLGALLGESGSNIKGRMRSYSELLELSGNAGRTQEFDELIRILDKEVRLITPADDEKSEVGGRKSEERKSEAVGNLAPPVPPTPASDFRLPASFQLTHDYLVPSLREWLTRKQKETRRGRAELRLEDRSAEWNAKQEDRHLPSLWEWGTIRALTDKKSWTGPQRKMMRKAGRYHAVRGVVVAVMLAVVGLAGWEGFGRLQAHHLRDRLLVSTTADAPAVVKQMGPYRHWVDPLLVDAYQEAKADMDARKQLHASLALLPVDPGQLEYLYGRLLKAEPQEVVVIREALQAHQHDVTQRLWIFVETPKNDQDERFRAACALASYVPDDPRWEVAAGKVAATLVIQKPFVIAQWTTALKPIEKWLVPSLAEFLADEGRSTSERSLIASVYGMYADDVHDAYGRLEKQLVEQSKSDDSAEARISLAKRQANIGVALMVMGRGENVWPLLSHRTDPTVRSFLIERLGPGGVDSKVLTARLDDERDKSVRRAILLSLGEFGLDRLSQAERQELSPRLLRLYEDDPDPGIHAAGEWLLGRWHAARKLQKITKRLASGKVQGKRGWYVNRQGQTMMIVPRPGEFWMGDGEERHLRRIGRSFAMASNEVTVEQFLRFRKDRDYPKLSAPTPTCPMHHVPWYEAAEYCNWLSGQEGIPNEQWCYLPNEAGKYAAGMTMAANYLQRTGYRLPTEAEWECACRAGAETVFSYGDTQELLRKYAWYNTNSLEQSHPVGSLKPNDFGLSDMHSNVWEWTQDLYKDYPKSQAGEAIEDKEDVLNEISEGSRVLRGGSFYGFAAYVGSAFRNHRAPTWSSDGGFRPARTMRP